MAKTAIKNESGVGSLSRLGFRTISDCLLAVPKDYRDFTTPIVDFSKAEQAVKKAYLLTPVSFILFGKDKRPTRSWKDAFRILWRLKDDVGNEVTVSIFGGLFPWRNTITATEVEKVLLWGYADEFNNEYTLRDAELIPKRNYGKISPVYAGKIGRVSASKVAEGVLMARDCVEEAAMSVVSLTGLRDTQFTKYVGMTANQLITNLHWPKTKEDGLAAAEAASKASVLSLVQSAVDHRSKVPSPLASIMIPGHVVSTLVSKLPFPLTNDQANAIQMIVQGLREPFPSLDLISADVGVGKSVAFMVPAGAAAMSGVKVAIMAPTDLLAEQLHREMSGYFPEIDIGLVKAGGKITSSVSVGTTALLGAAKRSNVQFGLVVVDEQHKFGSEQRAEMVKAHTNLIESTATPIPRSIALLQYGGYRLIQMKECPVKKAIHTRVVTQENNKKAMEFIFDIVKGGGQIAVVYPAVESTGESDGRTVKDAALRWEAKFPGRVGVIHGKLTGDEKRQVIADMKAGLYDILVASTLIEVGITLPSLKAIVNVDADLFGLAQLHQLRGRVARHGGKGYCFLLPSVDAEEDAIKRLMILEDCSNGYELAERDMKNRGYGNLDTDADNQHGKTATLFWNASIDPIQVEYVAKNLPQITAAVT